MERRLLKARGAMLACLILALLLAGCTLPVQTLEAGTLPPQASAAATSAVPVMATVTQMPLTEAATPPQSATQSLPPSPGPTEAVVTAVPFITPTLAASRAALSSYTIDAVYDYTPHTLTVSEAISYTNPSSQALDRLLLVAEANRYPGSLSVQSIVIDGQVLEGYSFENDRVSLPLYQTLKPGESVTLELGYTLVLPQIPPPSDTAQPQPYGFTIRQANLVDWYLYIPPYQDETGWMAPEPGYFGEHQALTVADFHVRLRIPEIGYPLSAAASAPAERQRDTYVYDLPAARSFAVSISPVYQVLSGTVGETDVYSYFFTFDATGGQAALDHTMKALALYNELFGAYPHKTLSVVQADFLDGMEYDGLYFLSRGFYSTYDDTPKGYLTAIAVHETAHQWWYGLVGNNQAMEPWLDEALCTYAERLYYERYYPDLVPWWWAYRVDFYQPEGAVNATIYDYPSFRTYRDAVYLNGARFLEAVRQQIGDEAFFAFFKDYTARFSGQQATSAGFFALLNEHTEADISQLISDYMFSPSTAIPGEP